VFPANNVNHGPTNGANIQNSARLTTPTYTYGTYKGRIKAASCKYSLLGLLDNENIITGYFIYREGPDDSDGDGIRDHSEIDVEILGEEPTKVYMTIWSGYESWEKHKRVERKIDMPSGTVELYEKHYYDHESQYPNKMKKEILSPDNSQSSKNARKISGFDATKNYYDYEFKWTSNSIEYYIDGKKVWTWNNCTATTPGCVQIPTLSAYYMFNVWYAANHWFPCDENITTFTTPTCKTTPPANNVIGSIQEISYKP